MRDAPQDPDEDADTAEADHDAVLVKAVEAWADAEIASDDDYEKGTFLGEWHLVVSRQGFDGDGDPVSQTLVIHSTDAPSRIIGILEEARLRLDIRLREHYSGGAFN